MSKMKLLSSFQLAKRFYNNGQAFLYLLRDDINYSLGLWLNQDPI